MGTRVSRRSVLASVLAPPEKITWPVIGPEEESAILDTLRSGKWSRSYGGLRVVEFEKQYAALTGSTYCLATANGTSALIAAMNAAEIGPGDAVLLPPYTFVATLNAILMQHALPVFVDSDLETFQMDARKLDAAITPDAVAVVPVHLGGAAVDLDTLLPVARRRRLRVIEDACQAHLGEWRGRKLGSLGDCGCFSFQASKNLNSGEGGAFITSDESLMDRAYAFHSNGRARKVDAAGLDYVSNGANLRLTEFQAAILLTQMTRLERQSQHREQNARYLASLLAGIPGVKPQRLYDGCTRNAWHLFMFRVEHGREAVLKALDALGYPGSSGYSPLNREPFLLRLMTSRHYQRIFGEKRLKEWRERNECPVNDLLCRQAVWLPQTTLLGPRSAMERIAATVAKASKS